MGKKDAVRVGIMGCGTISGIYLENSKWFEDFNVIACADLIPERSKTRAEEFGIPKVHTPEQMLADDEVELILNLTIPLAHAEVARAALQAGKHVYNEKPLTYRLNEAKAILELAVSKGLKVGCAPDTFLGGGIQTCRKLIDDGLIGEPVAATAFMMGHGHESWHPDPGFYYQPAGGPMFDMGPYYLTALTSLVGPIARVSGKTRVTFPERTITSQPKYGEKITVNTPTHIAGLIDFDNGAIGTIVTSFDVWGGDLPWIEIYGSRGTLSVPDPNTFGGPVRVRQAGSRKFVDVPLTHGHIKNSRGLGVADLSRAIRTGREGRASGERAYHVLEVMHAFHTSSDQKSQVEIESRPNRPEPLPLGLREGQIELS